MSLKDKLTKKLKHLHLEKNRSYGREELVSAKNNRRFPYLLKLLDTLIQLKNYKYTTIQINKNVKTSWHIDKNNIGKSYCLALGNFQKGGIDIRLNKNTKEFKNIDNKNKMVYYDGTIEHRTAEKIGGDRYAIIWFNRK